MDGPYSVRRSENLGAFSISGPGLSSPHLRPSVGLFESVDMASRVVGLMNFAYAKATPPRQDQAKKVLRMGTDKLYGQPKKARMIDDVAASLRKD